MGLASFNRRRRQLLKDEVIQAHISEVKEVINVIAFDDITKSQIIDILSQNGIEHNPRDKKEDLYKLLCENENNNKGTE